MSIELLVPHKLFYPDGKLRWEGFLLNGKGEGRSIRYHPTGHKASEFTIVNGQVHGEVKCWDLNGKILDVYMVEHGNGPHRVWHPNGILQGEVQTRKGLSLGKQVIWDEDGKKLVTSYHIDGKEVSKKKYLERAAKDKTLPSID